MRCPVSVVHAIVSSLENRSERISFYEIYNVPGTYNLDRRLLDLDEMAAFLPNTATSPEEVFEMIDE